jgi:hypothetical protein
MKEEESKRKRPRDLNLLVRSIVKDATGELFPSMPPAKKEKEEKPKNLGGTIGLAERKPE